MTDYSTAPPDARIVGLDVTRGFAVMGILTMNVAAFALPEPAYIHPLAWGDGSIANIIEWAINFVLFDGKMRGLFSMLFGASTLLVVEKAVAIQTSSARVHYGRMITLLVLGALHFYLIWNGDILFLYAACGLSLYIFRNQSQTALAFLGVALIGIQTLIMAAIMLVLRQSATNGPSDLQRAYHDLVGQFLPNTPRSMHDVALHLGSYADIAGHRLTTDLWQPLASVPLFGVETVGLMLVGMALFRAGLLSGNWPLARLVRWRNSCLTIGIIGNAALLSWALVLGLDPWIVLTSSLVWAVPINVVMSVGYAALFMELAQRFPANRQIARVCAVGRAAFSNYLGTSIIMTTVFYGYGGGLFGAVPRWALWGFVIAMWAVMLLWSKPWLDRYRYGPLEWVWRSLARLKLQPMVRQN